MAEDHIWKARCTAGRASLVIAEAHDRDAARDMTRGLLQGFLLACVQYDGWDVTLSAINQLAAEHRVPVSKPSLSVILGGKA